MAADTGIAVLLIEDSSGDEAHPLFDVDLAVERVSAARRAIDKSGTDIVLTGRSEGTVAGGAFRVARFWHAGVASSRSVVGGSGCRALCCQAICSDLIELPKTIRSMMVAAPCPGLVLAPRASSRGTKWSAVGWAIAALGALRW